MSKRVTCRAGFTLVEILIIVTFWSLLAIVLVDGIGKAREAAQLTSIVNNLRITEGAKEQWRISHKKTTGDTPDIKDIGPYLMGGTTPPSVVGETYKINAIGTPATAKIPRKLRNYPAGSSIVIP